MKLLVPQTSALREADARLARLAEFLGITWEPLFLDGCSGDSVDYVAKAFLDQCSCFVVNPDVIRDWTGGVVPADLVPRLASHFPCLLVHALRAGDPFHASLIKALSGDHLQCAQTIEDGPRLYEIASDSGDICGPFAGLSFGPANFANDRILISNGKIGAVRTPISIGGRPFMAVMKREQAKVFFLASADVLDVSLEIGDKPLSAYFSRFVPYAMALRSIFGEHSWRPSGHYASFIIDDPLLRPTYGYFAFEPLLNLMREFNFATTVAFIPHNYRRNSTRVLRMFHENRDRLAICFHGNDHTSAELASTDVLRLNTMMRIAEARMDAHADATGVRCPRVMVFPQEKFSVECMQVLKSRNFVAAVNAGPHPAGCRAALTIGEFAQPAILRYGNFPLFLRHYVGYLKREDIAFNLFFGRPVLIVEHHDIFRRVEALIDAVLMINKIAPDIQWVSLETAVINSALRRRTTDGVYHLRAYSGTVRVANDQTVPRPVLVEWKHSAQCPRVEQVLQNRRPSHSYEIDDSGIRLCGVLGPRNCQTFSVLYRNGYSSLGSLGLWWNTKAYLRRRLCELRDNRVSKNQFASVLARALQRSIWPKSL